MDEREVPIRGEMIRLGQLLKLAGVIGSGAEVKSLLASGVVTVNGEPEVRRGRQLRVGDAVEVRRGRQLRVADAVEVPGTSRLRITETRAPPSTG